MFELLLVLHDFSPRDSGSRCRYYLQSSNAQVSVEKEIKGKVRINIDYAFMVTLFSNRHSVQDILMEAFLTSIIFWNTSDGGGTTI